MRQVFQCKAVNSILKFVWPVHGLFGIKTHLPKKKKSSVPLDLHKYHKWCGCGCEDLNPVFQLLVMRCGWPQPLKSRHPLSHAATEIPDPAQSLGCPHFGGSLKVSSSCHQPSTGDRKRMMPNGLAVYVQRIATLQTLKKTWTNWFTSNMLAAIAVRPSFGRA